jgi:hypothetical protein
MADASSAHFVEHVPASPSWEDESQWIDARDGAEPSSELVLVPPSPAMSRMPLARHLRRSRTPGTTWWPAAKHAGVAAPPASTSGEIDAWTGGVAADGGVDPASAFLSGVRASSCCCRWPLLASPCFLAGSI